MPGISASGREDEERAEVETNSGRATSLAPR